MESRSIHKPTPWRLRLKLIEVFIRSHPIAIVASLFVFVFLLTLPDIWSVLTTSSPRKLTTKTTLIIMSYTNNEALAKILSLYNDPQLFADSIHEIVIVWNNPKIAFNHHQLVEHSYDSDLQLTSIPIRIYPQRHNSLANRWFIGEQHEFETESALFMDDDMFLNPYSLRCMLNTFVRHKEKIIAPSRTHLRTTRSFGFLGDAGWEYQNNAGNVFHMLLPGMSMFGVHWLPKLARTLQEYALLDIIDNQEAHCDDISMMLSMAMLHGGEKYLFGIEHVLIIDYSELRTAQKALTEGEHIVERYELRSECLTMIMHRFTERNAQKHSPMVEHHRNKDTIECRSCEWCDPRGCWYDDKKGK